MEREPAPTTITRPEMLRRPGKILALAVALAACAGPPAGGQTTPSSGRGVSPNIYEVAPEQLVRAQEAPPFIEVSGSAAVTVPSDQAQVSFAMETQEGGAAEAASVNADAMERVIAALRAGGLQGLELRTFGYQLQPVYATDSQRVRTIAGYVARNNVVATITDVDAVGRLIDTAIAAGANRVVSISFRATDTDPARAEATAAAVRSARAEAEVIANALGYGLGAPLEVRGGAQRPGPIERVVSTMAMAQDAPTPIEAGEQTVTANVTIRFALGPALSGR